MRLVVVIENEPVLVTSDFGEAVERSVTAFKEGYLPGILMVLTNLDVAPHGGVAVALPASADESDIIEKMKDVDEPEAASRVMLREAAVAAIKDASHKLGSDVSIANATPVIPEWHAAVHVN